MEEAASRQKRSADEEEPDWEVELRDGPFEDWEYPKGGFVNCSCIWGLFRDRNVTLRKPVRIHHGMADLSKKGWVKEFDDSPTMNWWQEGSECDQLGGFDGATLPPGLDQQDSIQMFISLMCRKLDLVFEKEVLYQNSLVANRYVPPLNAMGSHLDSDPNRRNEKNSCFCVDGFPCMKSGLLHMGPCKRTPSLPTGAPMALSYPHFYQADPHYLNAVDGLSPDKEQHEFYLDLNPELGIPLAIRPRFQLNLIINRDEDVEILSKFQQELVLPFLWAQDGFDTPSTEMADAIRLGLDIPAKGKRLVGVVLLAVGSGMLISSLVWILWYLRPRLPSSNIPTS
jgi:scavenger receptor class B protein 1